MPRQAPKSKQSIAKADRHKFLGTAIFSRTLKPTTCGASLFLYARLEIEPSSFVINFS